MLTTIKNQNKDEFNHQAYKQFMHNKIKMTKIYLIKYKWLEVKSILMSVGHQVEGWKLISSILKFHFINNDNQVTIADY